MFSEKMLNPIEASVNSGEEKTKNPERVKIEKFIESAYYVFSNIENFSFQLNELMESKLEGLKNEIESLAQGPDTAGEEEREAGKIKEILEKIKFNLDILLEDKASMAFSSGLGKDILDEKENKQKNFRETLGNMKEFILGTDSPSFKRHIAEINKPDKIFPRKFKAV